MYSTSINVHCQCFISTVSYVIMSILLGLALSLFPLYIGYYIVTNVPYHCENSRCVLCDYTKYNMTEKPLITCISSYQRI